MKLMILDGNSVINRAFYGVRPLTTREGLYTNAIYGFLNILEKLVKEEEPDALCVAFDLKGPTFRHLQYEGYKATRHGMPEELAQQMPVMKEVLTAMRIPIYACQGWEADDVIGTVSKICCGRDCQCVVVTGDRDSLQLVNDCVSVKLVATKGGQTLTTLYTPAVFEAEYGFEPRRLIDLKSLMGDSSDNIPGVAGVGPKTATDLLLKFGTLDGIYEHLDSPDIRETVRKKLRAGAESARLSYDLATIRCEAPIDFSPEDALRQEADKPALLALFTKLEFVRLIDRYGLRSAAPAPQAQAEAPALTCALPPADAPCALAFSPDGETVAVAWEAGVCTAPAGSIQALCEGGGSKTCADWKTVRNKLLDRGWTPRGFDFDVSLAGYLLDPSQSDYAVAKLAPAYLGRAAADLAAEAAAMAQLRPVLTDKLEAQGMDRLYREIEFPLCAVLSDMERIGVAVDRTALADFGAMLARRIDEAQAAVYALAGEEFNILSTKKLGEILFDKLGLPPVKKTKTGYSTNAEVLEKLRPKHPIIDAILEYRMLTKLSSTYADGLLKVIADDGRIHTTFQNMVTATGRLSSTEPNLQNIPVRTALGAEMRTMFVARPGWVLVDADYSQIELRVLAHIADDAHMQAAFSSGEDIHAVTASQVFRVPLDQVTPEMRRNAKAVNFGIVYGISAWSLSQDIGVSPDEARAYMDAYLENYSGVRTYMKDIVETAKAQGYVTTLYGRRRYLPELKSSNFNLRSFGERVALNTPIQGTAADIIKLAMIRVDQALREAGLEAKLILQVHDELIVECPQAETQAAAAILQREMEQVAQLKVPLVVEAKAGSSWYEAK